jgi:hypothetical protein
MWEGRCDGAMEESLGSGESGGRRSICERWVETSTMVRTYIYFINTSSASVPPGALYIRLSIGDMSACRIDWRISMTVARDSSCSVVRPVSLLPSGVLV